MSEKSRAPTEVHELGKTSVIGSLASQTLSVPQRRSLSVCAVHHGYTEGRVRVSRAAY